MVGLFKLVEWNGLFALCMSIVREVLGKEKNKQQLELKSYNDKRKRDKAQVASDRKLKAIAKHQKNVFLRYSSSGTNPD